MRRVGPGYKAFKFRHGADGVEVFRNVVLASIIEPLAEPTCVRNRGAQLITGSVVMDLRFGCGV